MNAGFSPEERCLIGVSGGRDSVALLHQLHTAGFRDLLVCHLDHALRAESEADGHFVAQMAARFTYEFVLKREDVNALAKQRRQSVETAARETRYSFFAQIAEERDCPRLFLAHHADDQVGTVLFNLFRGASAAGLSGMKSMSTRLINGVTLRISRPLIGTWREEIDEYVDKHDLCYIDDASNDDLQFTRNRFRHQIIPVLEEYFGRGIRSVIWRTAEILRAENELLDDLLNIQEMPNELSSTELGAEPVALQRRRLHAWLKFHGVPNVSFFDVEAVRGLLAGRVAKANLPGGWHARRRARKLFLESPPEKLSH